MSPHAPAAWIPVRYVSKRQVCSFCFNDILVSSPGHSRGTRGTKAWMHVNRQEWRCLECGPPSTEWPPS